MSDPKPTSGDIFDLARLRQLIELMKEHDLHEVDLCQGEQQIRLARGGAGSPVVYSAPAPVAPPVPAASPAAMPAAPAGDGPNIVVVKSPMVGTFYCRANPKAAPFVKVGDTVEASSVICIIEAMKVFNEIPAEVRGKVVAVLVNDEEPVDFGKPLFKIDTGK